MDINIAKMIIEGLVLNQQTFDSHDFIKVLMKNHYQTYVEILNNSSSFTSAHSQIANFLRNNANDLEIVELEEKNVSLDIFNNDVPCAKWQSIK